MLSVNENYLTGWIFRAAHDWQLVQVLYILVEYKPHKLN